MTTAQRERAAIVSTFRQVGPDAPTLCEGWDARDLAAHLFIRERRLDATAGIMLPFLAGYTARVQDRVATSMGWDELVGEVASGPPAYSPFKLLDPFVNVAEMFIHNEDVRRAQPDWQPRALDADTAAALRKSFTMMSRMAMRGVPARVHFVTPAGETLVSIGAGPEVTITGEPSELLLFVVGRDAARVTFDGDPQTVAAVKDARRGL